MTEHNPNPAVLLDATAIPANRGGVGRYVEELSRALDRADARLTVVCQRRDAEHFDAAAPQSRVVPIADELETRPARLAWEQVTLPRMVSRLGVQVVHAPHYTMPLAAGVPVVVTLHDAIFFSEPGLHLGAKGRFFRAWTRISLRRAAECVVDSQATADELVRYARADRSRMTVIPLGVDTTRFAVPSEEQIRFAREHLGLGTQPYVAFLGTLEPRKNVPALIRGFCSAVKNMTDPPALVLAGGAGWDSAVEPAIRAVPAGIKVIRPGYLPIEMLAGYLGGAELVAYPSLGEGFGLPVLEAMACGAAVLTTRRLSLPEVGGDAVAYSDVGAGDIAEGLRDLLADGDRRADLGRRAVERAAGFTWSSHAASCLEVYRRVADQAPHRRIGVGSR
ncbi:glycosyltransferase involved in cell wall biosynthesis [Nakamurella sp. UYEF19]|uniref:glycosyltransferase family 4 protein n=1 Tax=Nakamurella sp. UYEF19 TaxID=1756392 RepID=UPI0033915C02